MRISLVVAMSRNRVIGVNNQLPWRLPEDLKYFRAITWGKPIVMGRRTHESIGRALPGRHNIVITRNRDYLAQGCTVVDSLDAAWKAADSEEVMVIGGAEIYAKTLPLAECIYLTLVDEDFDGDTYFPQYDATQWQETSRRCFDADDNNPYRYCYLVLERKRKGLARFWGLLRAVSGDDAYERYLIHWRENHAQDGGKPLSRKAFFCAEVERKWNGLRRCC